MDTNWTTQARCLETNPEDFFTTEAVVVERIKRLCQGCPVRQICLAESIRGLETHGVWGGQDEVERRPLLQAERARRRREVAA